jgi:acyl-coenzyme A synthetase/AMP-(fatty) acid ligase
VLREGSAGDRGRDPELRGRPLADFKVPRRVLFVSEIHKGATGKLQRVGLAQKLGLVAQAA